MLPHLGQRVFGNNSLKLKNRQELASLSEADVG